MGRVRSAVVLVSIAVAAPAAAAPRYTRVGDVKVPVALSARTRPAPPLAAPPAPSLAETDAVRLVGLRATPTTAPSASALQAMRDVDLTRLGEPARSEHLLLLASGYAESMRYWRALAWRLTADAAAATTAAQRTKLRTAATSAEHKSKAMLIDAVKVYKALTDGARAASFARVDEALFGYADVLRAGRYLTEARAVYDKLLRDHPASRYVPIAYVVLAEHLAESGQLANAQAFLERARQFPRAAVAAYATYRLGWVHVRQQQYTEALEVFYQVAIARPQDPALAAAARRDFVVAYAEVGAPNKALAALRRIDAAGAIELARQLADLYAATGKHEAAVQVYRELVAAAPADSRVCAWRYGAARALLSTSAANAEKVGEIEALARLGRAGAGECRANAAALSGDLARAYHDEAVKTKSAEPLAYAVQLYRVYLDGLAGADRDETAHLYAEASWARAAAEPARARQIALWQDAAAAFSAVAARDRTRAADAAFTAVLAWLNAFDVDVTAWAGSVSIDAPTRGAAPVAIPTRERQLVGAIDALGAVDPAHAQLGWLRVVQAGVYRRFHEHDRAIRVLTGVVASHRAAPTAELAAQLAIDSLIAVQRLDELYELVDRLAADKRWLDDKPELRRTIHAVRRRSMRR